MSLENLVLRPNCLLTRSPLVFVSGPRSLFHTQPMGAELQTFMQAHGYQVVPLWLPFRPTDLRKKTLAQWLEKNKAKSFHFFMANETWQEFQLTLETRFHPHSTLNIVGLMPGAPQSHRENTQLSDFKVNKSIVPFQYHLHTLFCFFMNERALPFEHTLHEKNRVLYDRFLDHCIELAENEFKDLTSRM